MRKRYLIWSPYSTGHHPTYVSFILDAVGRLHPEAVVLCMNSDIKADPRFPSIQQKLEENGSILDLVDFEQNKYSADAIIGQFIQYRLLISRIRIHRIDNIVVPYFDSIWLGFLLLNVIMNPHIQIWPIWMRNQLHIQKSFFKYVVEKMKIAAAALISRRFNSINYTIDPCFFEYTQSHEKYKGLYTYIPEPIIQLRQAKMLQSEHRNVLLAIGVLDDRKSIIELLHNVLSIEGGYVIVRLIGKIHHEIMTFIADNSESLKGKVIAINKILTDEEYCQEIFNADIVWCVQRDHMLSSGTIAYAMAYNKCILYSDSGCIGYWGSAYSRAVLCSDACAASICKAVSLIEGNDVRAPFRTERPMSPFTLSWNGFFCETSD